MSYTLLTGDPAIGPTVTFVISKSRFKTHIREMSEVEFAEWVTDPNICCNLGRLTSVWYGLYLRKKGR